MKLKPQNSIMISERLRYKLLAEKVNTRRQFNDFWDTTWSIRFRSLWSTLLHLLEDKLSGAERWSLSRRLVGTSSGVSLGIGLGISSIIKSMISLGGNSSINLETNYVFNSRIISGIDLGSTFGIDCGSWRTMKLKPLKVLKAWKPLLENFRNIGLGRFWDEYRIEIRSRFRTPVDNQLFFKMVTSQFNPFEKQRKNNVWWICHYGSRSSPQRS